uniref:C2H2-type domain-containing protein n=1 Tax=Anopheles dirus TaxID=7168 RepID=A0A182NTK0_9DIPT
MACRGFAVLNAYPISQALSHHIDDQAESDGVSDHQFAQLDADINDSVAEDPVYHCYECTIDFGDSETLREHYESTHATIIHGWQSFGISEISLFDSTTDEEQGRNCSTQRPLKKSTPFPRYRCCGCLMVFETDVELEQHAEEVRALDAKQTSTSRPFQCNICYHVYSSQKTLDIHQRSALFMSHLCSWCGIQFTQKAQLIRHEYSHTKLCVCDVCHKHFRHPEYLKKHMEKIHADRTAKVDSTEKRYVCSQCGKSVYSESYLKNHMKLHSDKTPHVCHLCGKSFKLLAYLRWHMDRHKGTYSCSQCSRTFKNRSQLEDHKNVHTDSRVHDCDLCGKKYHTKVTLNKHRRKVHNMFRRHWKRQ